MVLTINNVSVDDPSAGWWLLDGSVPLLDVAMTYTEVKRAGRDGVTLSGGVANPAVMRLRFHVERSVRAGFLALFRNGVLQVRDSERPGQVAHAVLESTATVQHYGFASFDEELVNLHIPGGCWRSETVQVSPLIVGTVDIFGASPTAPPVYRNLHANPGAVSGGLFGAWAGASPNTAVTGFVSSTWSRSGSAYRCTWTNSTLPLSGSVGALFSGAPANVRCTMVLKAFASKPGVLSGLFLSTGSADTPSVMIAHSGDTYFDGVNPVTLWVTFTRTVGENSAARWVTNLTNRGDGDWVEVSEVDLYEGDYDPARDWVYSENPATLELVYGTDAGNSVAWDRADYRNGFTAPIQDAEIVFHGPVTNPELTDSSGAYVIYRAAIPAGQTVKVDTATGRAWQGAVEVSGQLDFNGPRGVFEITPVTTSPTEAHGRVTLSRTAGTGGATISTKLAFLA